RSGVTSRTAAAPPIRLAVSALAGRRNLPSFPTRRSSDLGRIEVRAGSATGTLLGTANVASTGGWDTFTEVSAQLSGAPAGTTTRSEEHTSELQSRENLVCRRLLEKKKSKTVTSSRRRPQQ